MKMRYFKVAVLIGVSTLMLACPTQQLLHHQVTGELKVYGKIIHSEDGVSQDVVVMYPQGPKVNKNAILQWSFNEKENKGFAEIISYGRQAYVWPYHVDELTPTWVEADPDTEEPDGLIFESPVENMFRAKVRMVFSQPKDENGNPLPEQVSVTITQSAHVGILQGEVFKDSVEEEFNMVTFTTSQPSQNR